MLPLLCRHIPTVCVCVLLTLSEHCLKLPPVYFWTDSARKDQVTGRRTAPPLQVLTVKALIQWYETSPGPQLHFQ